MADKNPKSNGKATTSSGRTPKAGPKKPGWHRAKKGMLTPGTDLMSQVVRDKLDAQTEAMRDMLSISLDSTSPTALSQLQAAAEVFLQAFANASVQELRHASKRRLYYALDKAVDTLPQGGIRGYFVGAVKAAYHSSNEEHRPVVGTPMMMPQRKMMATTAA